MVRRIEYDGEQNMVGVAEQKRRNIEQKASRAPSFRECIFVSCVDCYLLSVCIFLCGGGGLPLAFLFRLDKLVSLPYKSCRQLKSCRLLGLVSEQKRVRGHFLRCTVNKRFVCVFSRLNKTI